MASTTSLLRSAASTRRKLQAQQDAEVAFDYSNSSKTYEQFSQYTKYLQDRFSSSSDASDRLSLQKNIKSAQSGFISNEIQRNTQAVMEGRATLEDKQQTIGNLWQQAVDVGNYDLALSLQSNWDSLSMQIQARNEQAAQAQKSLFNAQTAYNKKVATETGRAYGDLASSLQGGIEDLNRAFREGGQVAYNKAAKAFVDSHRDAIKLLGIDLPSDYSTNIGQLTEGLVKGIANYYALAAQATEVDNPDAAQSYKEKLQNIVTGQTTFASPAGGRLTAAQVTQLAQTPNKFLEYVNPQTGQTELRPSTISSYSFDDSGRLVRNYSGKLKVQPPENDKELKKQLEKMGFGNIEYNADTGTYQVQLSDETKKWFGADMLGVSDGATIPLTPTATGFQFLGHNNKLYNLATDKKGLAGLFEVDPIGGLKHIHGQYGFDQGRNTATENISTIVQAQRWRAPMLTPQQSVAAVDKKASGGKIPIFTPVNNNKIADPLNVMGFLAGKRSAPQMVQRPGGGFNFIGSNGQPISAYTYAQQTGQAFRTVLSQAAAKGDSYAASALRYAGNDGAYNPAQVDLATAKNWNSLTWGSNVKLQTPQAARVAGVSIPGISSSTGKIPLFNQGFK